MYFPEPLCCCSTRRGCLHWEIHKGKWEYCFSFTLCVRTHGMHITYSIHVCASHYYYYYSPLCSRKLVCGTLQINSSVVLGLRSLVHTLWSSLFSNLEFWVTPLFSFPLPLSSFVIPSDVRVLLKSYCVRTLAYTVVQLRCILRHVLPWTLLQLKIMPIDQQPGLGNDK